MCERVYKHMYERMHVTDRDRKRESERRKRDKGQGKYMSECMIESITICLIVHISENVYTCLCISMLCVCVFVSACMRACVFLCHLHKFVCTYVSVSPEFTYTWV